MEQEFIAYPTVRGVAYAERTIPETFPPHWHNDAEFTGTSPREYRKLQSRNK